MAAITFCQPDDKACRVDLIILIYKDRLPNNYSCILTNGSEGIA
jgi:hypothetical protein